MPQFPTTLPNLSNPSGAASMNSPSHSGQHAAANDEIEAIAAKVGITNSADPTSLDYRVKALETSPEGTSSGTSPFDYGAIADGASHPLSERYASLAAAQVVYPFATSLTNEIDRCAIQAAINAWPKSTAGNWRGGRVDLGVGRYVLDDSIIVDLYYGMMLVGVAVQATRLIPGAGLSGKPVVKFQNCRRSGVVFVRFTGNSSAPPSACIEAHENHGAEPAGVLLPSTELIVEHVDMLSESADGFVRGVHWTTAGLDQNNDLAEIRDVRIINFSEAAFDITHSNSLLHTILGGNLASTNATASMFRLAGGSFKALAVNSSVSGWVVDFGAGTYEHPSFLVGLVSEPPAGTGKLARSAAGANGLRLAISDSAFESGISGTTKAIDWAAPGSQFEMSQSSFMGNGGVFDFGTDGGTVVNLTDWKSNISSISWGGILTDVAHTDYSGSMAYLPVGSAKRVVVATYNGQPSALFKVEFANGANVCRLFMDTADNLMKVTDASGTRQV